MKNVNKQTERQIYFDFRGRFLKYRNIGISDKSNGNEKNYNHK